MPVVKHNPSAMPIGNTRVQYVCGVNNLVWSQGHQPRHSVAIDSSVDIETPISDRAAPYGNSTSTNICLLRKMRLGPAKQYRTVAARARAGLMPWGLASLASWRGSALYLACAMTALLRRRAVVLVHVVLRSGSRTATRKF